MLMVLAVNNEDKKIAYKSYPKKLWNTNFIWDGKGLSYTDTQGCSQSILDHGIPVWAP